MFRNGHKYVNIGDRMNVSLKTGGGAGVWFLDNRKTHLFSVYIIFVSFRDFAINRLSADHQVY